MIAGAKVFLDTGVLVYAAMGRETAPDRFALARRIVLEEDYGTSAQVLAEFYAAVTHNDARGGRRPLSPEAARRWVRVLMRKPCQPVDQHVVANGIDLAISASLTYADAAIVAAAEALGATTLYSDNLGDGRTFGPVRVVDPFKGVAA